MSYEQEPMRVVGDRIISERQYQQEQRELAWLEFLHTQSDKGDEDEYYQHCIENNIQYYTRAERVQRIKDLIARSEKEAQRSADIGITIAVLSTLGVLALLVKGCTMLQ